MRDITNYMTAGAFSLLDHAANNREKWLSRFYAIGKEAVRPRKDGELSGFVINRQMAAGKPTEGSYRVNKLLEIMDRAGVEWGTSLDGRFAVIPMNKPYGNFANALLEKQDYPHLLYAGGNPIQPYDVTAHTLPLLMNVPVEQQYNPLTSKRRTCG